MTRTRWFIVLLLLALTVPVSAQDSGARAYFKVDNAEPLVGQPIHLTLVVELPPELTLNDLPDLKSDWQFPFLVKDMGERTETDQGNLHAYEQVLTVVVWQTGDFLTPETFVSYQSRAASPAQRLLVQPATLKVPSVLDGTDMQLHPLKSLVWLPYTSPWIIAAIVGSLIVGVGGLVTLFRSRARHRRIAAKASTPAQTALAELRRLAGQSTDILTLYLLVADCLRRYVQSKFDIRALELTTDELVDSLDADARLPVRLQKDLERLIRQSDLVKFARAEPGSRSAQRLVAIARDWIERAEDIPME